MVLPIDDPGVPGFRNVPFAGEMKRPQPLGHFVKSRHPVAHIVAAVAGRIDTGLLQGVLKPYGVPRFRDKLCAYQFFICDAAIDQFPSGLRYGFTQFSRTARSCACPLPHHGWTCLHLGNDPFHVIKACCCLIKRPLLFLKSNLHRADGSFPLLVAIVRRLFRRGELGSKLVYFRLLFVHLRLRLGKARFLPADRVLLKREGNAFQVIFISLKLFV